MNFDIVLIWIEFIELIHKFDLKIKAIVTQKYN